MKKAAAPREPQFSFGEIFLARWQANPRLPDHVRDSRSGSPD
jgi:hypothetical protein